MFMSMLVAFVWHTKTWAGHCFSSYMLKNNQNPGRTSLIYVDLTGMVYKVSSEA